MSRRARWLAPVLCAGVAACTPRPAVTVVHAPEPLPTLRIEEVVGTGLAPEPGGPLGRPVGDESVGAGGPGPRVNLTATGADLRALLAALADAAGVSLVVAPEVQGRVTVHFEDVPADEALRTLIREAGLMVASPLAAPWGPVVFYVAPVNVNEADAETIRARFGVSEELARFIVRARIPSS